MKTYLRQKLLQAAGIKRIHIVGCARSGTTMLHYSMAAFAHTILFDKEISPWTYPQTQRSIKLALQYVLKKNAQFLVTKRNSRWYTEKHLKKLIEFKNEFGTKIIHIVRDPRDVLTSRHKLSGDTYYVSADRWKRSLEAGLMLDKVYKDSEDYLLLRYEDVVCEPSKVLKLFEEKFDLKLRPYIKDWSRLASNIEELQVGGKMIAYMHRLRDFDPTTIGKWHSDKTKRAYIEDLLETKNGQFIRQVMKQFNYPDPQ